MIAAIWLVQFFSWVRVSPTPPLLWPTYVCRHIFQPQISRYRLLIPTRYVLWSLLQLGRTSLISGTYVLNFRWWRCEEFWKTEWRIGVDQIRCFGRIDVHKERAFPMLEMEPPATDDATRPEEDQRTSNLWSIRGSAHFNCLKGQSKKFQSSTLNSKGCDGSSVYVLREPLLFRNKLPRLFSKSKAQKSSACCLSNCQ